MLPKVGVHHHSGGVLWGCIFSYFWAEHASLLPVHAAMLQTLQTLLGAAQRRARAWKEKGRRMVLKPRSWMRQATVLKFIVSAVGPSHRPSTIVALVSNPNQFTPFSASGSPFAPVNCARGAVFECLSP